MNIISFEVFSEVSSCTLNFNFRITYSRCQKDFFDPQWHDNFIKVTLFEISSESGRTCFKFQCYYSKNNLRALVFKVESFF